MAKLTKRQNEVLQLIQDQMEATGSPPTRAEIAQRMGFRSPNAAEDHLRALARKGMIELIPGTSRGIRLLRDGGLPIIGQVAAGQPILAEENVEATYRIEKSLFSPSADYLLRVKGESMKKAGILDGDLLAVHSTPEVFPGQIVIARLGDEVTVKRFFRQEHKVTLAAENDDFAPIEVDLRTQPLVIEGLGVGVIRSLSAPTKLQ